MKRPLVNFTLVFIMGMLFSKFLTFSAWELLIVTGILFTYILFSLSRKVPAGESKTKGLLILSLSFLIGLFWHQVAVESFKAVEKDYLNQNLSLKGTIIKEPELRQNHFQYYLSVETISLDAKEQPAEFLVLVKDYEPKQIFSYGDRIVIDGKIKLPNLPANPGEFDYYQYLFQRGVAGIVSSWQSQQIEKVGLGSINPVIGASLSVKDKLNQVFTETLTKSNAQLLSGMIFGGQGLIEDEVLEVFQQVGLTHILSVSGLHVGIILAAVLLLANTLGLSKINRFWFSALLLIFYAFMTGLTPSVLRAAIMALTVLFGLAIDKEKDWPTSLALAALIILLISPLSLWDIGFQLSFVAAWSILYLVPLMNKTMPWLNPYFKSLLTVPLAAQLGTWPLVAYYFNIFSPVSILANVLLVELVGIIIPLGILAAFFGLLSITLAEIINVTTEVLLELMKILTFFLAKIPGAFMFVKSPPLWFLVFWFAVLIVTGSYFNHFSFRQKVRIFTIRHRGKVFTINSLLLVFLLWQGVGGFGTEPLRVTFLDVGQGDSAVILTPGGKTMVIDAGGRPASMKNAFDPGEKIVAPFLQRQGLNKIDVLVLSHPHEDHVGGAAAIINKFQVDLVVVAPVENKSKGYQRLLSLIKEKNIPLAVGEIGDVIELDQVVEFLILHPSKSFTEATKNLNDNSIVVKLLHGKKGFLFTGDIEKPAIEQMLKAPPGQLKADALKVPHHGSRTSLVPKFYQVVQPQIAIFSVGAQNKYGHPHPQVLAAFRKLGVVTYRTDQDGAVTIESDGQKLEVQSQKGVVH